MSSRSRLSISPKAASSRISPARTTAALLPAVLVLVTAVLVAAVLGLGRPCPASAMVRLDFEQKYFVHPGRQVWDFCLIRPDSIYHIYYHSILEATPHAAYADTIWHATSPDLAHWDIAGPVLTSGPDAWESSAIWAPDVFWDGDRGRWTMAYTGCDPRLNQRIGLAISPDLYTWTKEDFNPTVEPDTNAYVWDEDLWWSDFRDPFVYRRDDTWHVLVTAKKVLTATTGVLFHGTSSNLIDWTDAGPLFNNDGSDPWRVLESPQYHVIGDYHHLLFGEYDTGGITLLSAPDPAGWTMASRVLLDEGYAPEVKEFDPGIHLFARLAPFYLPLSTDLAYVVRLDTLRTNPDGSGPRVHRPHPLAADWVRFTGLSTAANPTFGDNPLWRGQPSVGLVGNGYFSSQEYYQGPLSGRGAPGVSLGDGATGTLESFPFTVTGNRMSLLVGGGDYPQTCYVALVAAADSAILLRETGQDDDFMTPRTWDLGPFLGLVCCIRIVDQETRPFGHLNVDQIVETRVEDPAPAATPPPGQLLLRHQAYPNPCNPFAWIAFHLTREMPCRVRIHDARGRFVWDSGPVAGRSGPNRVRWPGTEAQGWPAASGTYLYSIESGGQVLGRGKVALVR